MDNIIHHMLKDNRCIGEAKEHHNTFKMAIPSCKSTMFIAKSKTCPFARQKVWKGLHELKVGQL
jgi:hypothetical protein